jgi:hypothetical protein
MAIHYSFHRRLYFALKYLAKGKLITTKDGHILAIPDGLEEPGFVMNHEMENEVVIQIGSSSAWSCLIQYAKQMTQDETSTMAIECMDVKLPKGTLG